MNGKCSGFSDLVTSIKKKANTFPQGKFCLLSFVNRQLSSSFSEHENQASAQGDESCKSQVHGEDVSAFSF